MCVQAIILMSSLTTDTERRGNTDKYILWLGGVDVSEGRKHVLMFQVRGNYALCSPALVQHASGPFVSHSCCSVTPVAVVLLECRDEN